LRRGGFPRDSRKRYGNSEPQTKERLGCSDGGAEVKKPASRKGGGLPTRQTSLPLLDSSPQGDRGTSQGTQRGQPGTPDSRLGANESRAETIKTNDLTGPKRKMRHRKVKILKVHLPGQDLKPGSSEWEKTLGQDGEVVRPKATLVEEGRCGEITSGEKEQGSNLYLFRRSLLGHRIVREK